jgi:hypothetical protein
MLKNKFYFGLIALLVAVGSLQAQQVMMPKDVEPSRFDYGKMWTFEHVSLDYLEDTYDFRPNQEWLDKARMSSLRFASWCSSSFISPDGLILTNHHCSRGVVGDLMKDGENFDEQGFYATTQAEERPAPGLFVKQLAQIADVTEMIQEATAKAADEQELAQMRDAALQDAIAKYSEMEDWAGLEIEPVIYYSGGKYSLYGYKRYDDIRLVLIPELQLGYFGGDPDNFTYPRYALDFTLWRAYENGKPANTSGHYFPFNAEGADEGDLVFVTGNPGSTERYRTMAQLEYDRDYRYNILHTWLKHRMELLQEKYDQNPSHDLQETIFSLSNSIKAYGGILSGLHDPYLMAKKAAMEEKIKAQSPSFAVGNNYWAQLAAEYEPMKPYSAEATLLGPTPLNGYFLISSHYFERYRQALKGGAGQEDLDAIKEQLMNATAQLGDPFEEKYLATLLGELKKFAGPGDDYVKKLLDGRSPAEAAKEMIEDTKFDEPNRLEKVLNSGEKKIDKSKDPIALMGRLIVPKFQEAQQAMGAGSAKRRALEGKISNEVFNIFGLNIPPDATFTLRLADGVVKGYDYNGTEAPTNTTYFGMYDRHYSHKQEFPWSLPERWKNPPAEMLSAPLNMVSTNDIIGGNSGSPLINKEGECVGLIFDGNIESLPGNFIFNPDVNRTVSVHAGGIHAALKYIYKADRILQELK